MYVKSFMGWKISVNVADIYGGLTEYFSGDGNQLPVSSIFEYNRYSDLCKNESCPYKQIKNWPGNDMQLRVFKESFSSQNSVVDIEKEFYNVYEARKKCRVSISNYF